ncbi:hypothetical protein D3C87_1812060 [compost metagenome]
MSLASTLWEISSNTLISDATSLRVLLILLCNSTLLREVLLSWMLYLDANRFLNAVPS